MDRKRKPLISRLNELAEKDVGASKPEDDVYWDGEIRGLGDIYGASSDGEQDEFENNGADDSAHREALDVLYGDRPEILEAVSASAEPTDVLHVDAEKVESKAEKSEEITDEEQAESSGGSELAVQGGETAEIQTAAAPAVAVRRIRENNKLKINKFDAFFIKLWSLIVAVVVGAANGINWVVEAVFKRRLPDKYVRAFIATVIIVLLILLFTLPFSIEIKTDEQIDIFSDGLLPVSERVYVNNEAVSRWGYMNEKGKMVIPAQYVEALPFMHGVAWVRTMNYNQFGSITDNYWSLINKKGKPVGKDVLKFDHAVNGLLPRPVGEFTKDIKLAWVYTAGKYGFIKSNGTYAITPRYEYVESFSNGLARVRMGSVEFYINSKGNQVGNTYSEVKSFTEGMGAVMINEIWGFVDVKGDVVVQPQYDAVSPYKGGFAAVRNGEAYGIIDIKGRTVVEPIRYTDILPLSKSFEELINSIRLEK